jgi:hypothetical protein
MKLLAGYSLFILIVVLVKLINDWISSKTKHGQTAIAFGVCLILPIIFFYILLMCGFPV